MKKIITISAFLLFFVFPLAVQAQPVTLNADGPGNTYELINSVLAPGYDVVEHPECVHPGFGRHIAEVWDATLGAFVFEFYSHVLEDNDRCISFDRQRVEIKTYDQSPANLKGTLGETITYKWRFKLAAGFQPSTSFTHIHQIKPVNGDDGNPLFTLTPRKGTPNKMELIHNNVTKVAIVNLSLFDNVWVEATQVIKVGANGTYSMDIRRVSDNVSILSYSSSDIMTIRPDNDFIRPKWGIYRSLNNAVNLRDDSIRFNAFSIEELAVVLPIKLKSFSGKIIRNAAYLEWSTEVEINNRQFNLEHSVDAINFSTLMTRLSEGNSSNTRLYQFADNKIKNGSNFYRLKMIDNYGISTFSYTILIQYKNEGKLLISPNPVNGHAKILGLDVSSVLQMQIVTTDNKILLETSGTIVQLNNKLNTFLMELNYGLYFVSFKTNYNTYFSQFIKG